MSDDQVIARNMIVEVDDEKAGKIKIAGNPIKMSSIPEESKRKAAPIIGEHTQYVLKEYLGYDEGKVNELKSKGVI